MASYEAPPWAEHPQMVAFYAQHRNRAEDLYPSERRFLPWLARQATTVLDVGCAAGGFSNIWRHYRPDIVYTGVDVSVSLIAAARRLHPNVQFYEGDCTAGLSLPDRYASIVQALGWLHWEPQYERVIQELWRLTDRFLFFDVRLVADSDQAVSGKQQLALIGPWDGETTTDYICVAWPLFAALIADLHPMVILGYGYWGRPAETVMGVDRQICFGTFVLEKGPLEGEARFPTACVDLPFAWPAALAGRVMVLPVAELNALVPQA
jgi:SAM-dependent methyltransferase